MAGQLRKELDPEVQAQALLALVIGSALSVLLDQATGADALEVVVNHLQQLSDAI